MTDWNRPKPDPKMDDLLCGDLIAHPPHRWDFTLTGFESGDQVVAWAWCPGRKAHARTMIGTLKGDQT
jgi:hypothetical protein